MPEISLTERGTRFARGGGDDASRVRGALRTARPALMLRLVLFGPLRNSFVWLWIVPLPFGLYAPAAAAGAVDTNSLPPAAEGRMDFVRDIKPLLDNRCLKCHSEEKPKSHFRLTSRENALKGGDHGIDIIPGDSARSPLIHYVARLDPDIQMPPEDRGTPLTPAEVGQLRAWIDQGVAWEQTTNQPNFALEISPTFSWTTVTGDKQKFRELYWQRDQWLWGLENFEYVEKPGPDWKVTVAGHVRLDDYKLTLSAEKNDLGFTRFGWEQYRKYFDDSGGYNPALAPFSFELNRDLHLDVGRAWAEVGLTLPRWPKIVIGYEYQYRDGTEATLQWGPVRNGIQPGSLTNSIYPGFKDLFERVHILKFDADYEIAGVLLSDNFRGEWYRLSTSEVNESGYTLGGPVASTAAFTTANEKQTYFQGANTFHAEKQFTGWLFGAGGYLYSKLDANGSMDVENSNPNSLNAPSDFFPGYIGFQTQRLELGRESHVFSLSGLVGPWEGLSLTFATQNEWTRETGLSVATNLSIASPFFGVAPLDGLENLASDLDRRTFSQEAGLRFTKVPFTTLYADARLEQDDFGQYQEQDGGITPTPFVQNTDARSYLKDFRAGFNTSPWRRVSLSGHFRRYDNETDYNNLYKYDPVFKQGFEGYPAFIRSRDLRSNEAEAKLALQMTSWLKTSLTYQWLGNDYHTATLPVTNDFFHNPPLTGISPGGDLLAGTYNAHIATFNATLTPWHRLFVSTTLAFQNARTVTSANGNASVAPYAGNIYSVLVDGNYTLDDKTSLVAAYSFSRADFTQDNGTSGLPLGLRYGQHAVQAGLKRRLSKGATLGLEYRYYRYDEPSGGGFNDFQAHAVFATLACRWP
ncbi:MAG TPA: c-type cytochrome domain-containing protein [Candidatus Acidoferrum sp.]|jgi:hypothetical protein|nr:c-type cytochrome domain-containing protein [Candidatus Acidoferrum sp.]